MNKDTRDLLTEAESALRKSYKIDPDEADEIADKIRSLLIKPEKETSELLEALHKAEQLIVTFAMTFPNAWDKSDQKKLNEIRATIAKATA